MDKEGKRKEIWGEIEKRRKKGKSKKKKGRKKRKRKKKKKKRKKPSCGFEPWTCDRERFLPTSC